MKAILEAFLQSLQKLSREQLIQKLVRMKENEMNQSVILTEMQNTSTAMSRDYNKVLESIRKLQAENTQLKKDYKTVCEQNVQLLRKVFGRQSEKMIYMDEETAPEPVRLAVMLMVSHYYENRDNPDRAVYGTMRIAFENLLYPYRDPDKMF